MNLRTLTSRRWLSIFIVLILFVAASSLSIIQAQEQEEAERIGLELVAEGMSSPVALVSAKDGTGRLFVVDQAGYIWILGGDGTLMPNPFLDITGLIVPLRTDYDERGVLGLAFHPDYANNGRFFVYYTAPLRAEGPVGWDHTNVLAEFSVSADNPDLGDLASQRYILQIDQPQFNHNAGHIAFGPDGYLYVPLGDGGGGNDTDQGHTPGLGNGQDTTNLHGSILRLDVNGDAPYTIPADNPFVGEDDIADEIYAYGFRNPYHISFDMAGNNQLFAADAGQELYEEVSIVTSGGNYGWNIKEGTHCFDPVNPEVPPTECATTGARGEPLIDPIIEYGHDLGVVVVGGYVYRGTAISDLEGYYIFGDYNGDPEGMSGTLFWAEADNEDEMWEWGELLVAGMENERLAGLLLGFGEDDNGEIYVLTSQSFAPAGDTGQIWRLVAADDDDDDESDDNDSGDGDNDDDDDGEDAPPDPVATEESSG